jgi:hypothetical protein
MDLKYLEKEIIPLRKKEIEEGKNACTRQPIYVVLDLQDNFMSGHSEHYPSTNYKGLNQIFGYYDAYLEPEDRKFKISKTKMKQPVEVTQFYTDRIIAFFFTSKGANDYMEYQRHNLKNAYVYVFYSGYGNREMDKILQNS